MQGLKDFVTDIEGEVGDALPITWAEVVSPNDIMYALSPPALCLFWMPLLYPWGIQVEYSELCALSPPCSMPILDAPAISMGHPSGIL
eukprot:COSAG05_NODE_1276_length_5305_cov_7.675759_3_plen_88_part_00